MGNIHDTYITCRNTYHSPSSKSSENNFAGKIRGIIPHQPVYIKKMEHSVSEVKVNHILSLLIFYVRYICFLAIVPLLHFRFRLFNPPQTYLDHRPKAKLLTCCDFCSKNISDIFQILLK